MARQIRHLSHPDREAKHAESDPVEPRRDERVVGAFCRSLRHLPCQRRQRPDTHRQERVPARRPTYDWPTSSRCRTVRSSGSFTTASAATAMPAWEEGDPAQDKASWKLVHFIRHLPQLTPEELDQMKALNPKTKKDTRKKKPPSASSCGETMQRQREPIAAIITNSSTAIQERGSTMWLHLIVTLTRASSFRLQASPTAPTNDVLGTITAIGATHLEVKTPKGQSVDVRVNKKTQHKDASNPKGANVPEVGDRVIIKATKDDKVLLSPPKSIFPRPSAYRSRMQPVPVQ